MVSTAAFHARDRGSVPGLGGLKETKMFLPHPRVKVSIVGSLRDREVACSASDRQGSNFESCVWRTVSSQSSHQPQEVLLAQFSLYVHKGGLKPDSFHFIFIPRAPFRIWHRKYIHVIGRQGLIVQVCLSNDGHQRYYSGIIIAPVSRCTHALYREVDMIYSALESKQVNKIRVNIWVLYSYIIIIYNDQMSQNMSFRLV